MGKRKAHQVIATNERRARLVKIEESILRGYTNQNDLAAKFGVTQQQISNDLREIHDTWKREGIDKTKERRRLRVKQLEYVIQLAHNAFQVSRGDVERGETEKHEVCKDCEGMGVKEGDWCDACDGNGFIKSVSLTIKKQGQAGDPNWLAIIKNCNAEINRLEGNYTPPVKRIQKNTTVSGAVLHAGLTAKDGNLYLLASGDDIIQAKVALERLKQSAKENAKEQGMTIEGSVEKRKRENTDE